MSQAGVLNRIVTQQECSWLSEDLPKGKVVYRYYGQTYGCISSDGEAVTDKPDETPFYEIPESSVDWTVKPG